MRVIAWGRNGRARACSRRSDVARADIGILEELGDGMRALAAGEASALLAQMWTALPGIVQAFTAGARPVVDVQPVPQVYHEDDDGNRIASPLPVIPHVPVFFPGGGGGPVLAWALAPGDSVLLVFASRSIDLWAKNGENPDPQDERQFDYSDAMAIPLGFGLGSMPVVKLARDGDTVAIDTTKLLAFLDPHYVGSGSPPGPIPPIGTVSGSSVVRSA